MKLAVLFAMLVPSALAQLPCQSPTQLFESSTPLTDSQFGRYGAINGDTALVTSEEPGVGGGPFGPLQVHVFDRDPRTRYCDPAVVNSSGEPGRQDVLGTASGGSTDLTAVASVLPSASFGLLVSARLSAFISGPGGSAGILCVAGAAFGRFPVRATGIGGTFQQAIDPLVMPSAPGPYALQPGDTAYFQAWFRDGGSSNFTDALAITFGE